MILLPFFSRDELPLSRFLDSYAASGTLRAHMPGHKGRALAGDDALAAAYARDITEIRGADSLFEADGILRDGEAATAALYGSGGCCWSAGGSTLCIQAMLARMRAEGRTVIAARTVHRAFLNACVLLGLRVEWVFPEAGGLVSGTYAPAAFAAALDAAAARGERACVYVTSPDYLGHRQDIAALAAICHARGARLLVDDAHGPHLAFLETNVHPIALGADFCCDSAHKLLPALTGAAVLHCRDAADAAPAKQAMVLFGSTSPSYLILRSIEQSMAWLAGDGAARVKETAATAEALRRALPQYDWIGEEPFHLTAACDGLALADDLRAAGVECEYADGTACVLLLSPCMTDAELTSLRDILAGLTPCPPRAVPPLSAPPRRILPMREAALAPCDLLAPMDAIGRVCGAVQVPCPPAVPLLVSGEQVDEAWAALYTAYGIEMIAVVG